MKRVSPVAAAAWLVAATVVIVPLAVYPDSLDRFRVVKESVVRTEALLGFLIVIAAAVFGRTERMRELLEERAVIAIGIAGIAWSGITTLTSTQRAISTQSFITTLTTVFVFFLTWYAAPRVSLKALDLMVPAIAINAVISATQEYGIYNPFTINEQIPYRHLTATAFIGNPNIVGTYMALATIILAAASTRTAGLRRWWYFLGAVIGTASVLVSGTRTAVIALVAGVGILAVGVSIKRFAVIAVALMLVVGVGFALRLRVIRRLIALPKMVATVGLDTATSGRITPALAALGMFRDHPITGVGPGAFKFQFMEYYVRVRGVRARSDNEVRPTSFAETHNDHLQILAETGLPGLLLFFAAIVILVRRIARSDVSGDDRAPVARGMLVPLVVVFLLLCLAQFPLHVAITRHLIVTMAGLMLGWTRPRVEGP